MTKTVLITGASCGIGTATALLAAQRGWDAMQGQDAAEAEAADVRKAGRKALVVQADVELRDVFCGCAALGSAGAACGAATFATVGSVLAGSEGSTAASASGVTGSSS